MKKSVIVIDSDAVRYVQNDVKETWISEHGSFDVKANEGSLTKYSLILSRKNMVEPKT